MPKVTKNNEVLINILKLTPSVQTTLNNQTEQLKVLVDLSVIEYSTRLEDVKSLLGRTESISGALFTRVLATSLQAATFNNAWSIGEIVLLLSEQNYDQEEVIAQLKRNKSIDAIFTLALLWKLFNDQNEGGTSVPGSKLEDKLGGVAKIIRLLVVSYPVDLMISGEPYLAKWRAYLQAQASVMSLKNSVRTQTSRIMENEDTIGKQANQFIDIIIPL